MVLLSHRKIVPLNVVDVSLGLSGFRLRFFLTVNIAVYKEFLGFNHDHAPLVACVNLDSWHAELHRRRAMPLKPRLRYIENPRLELELLVPRRHLI